MQTRVKSLECSNGDLVVHPGSLAWAPAWPPRRQQVPGPTVAFLGNTKQAWAVEAPFQEGTAGHFLESPVTVQAAAEPGSLGQVGTAHIAPHCQSIELIKADHCSALNLDDHDLLQSMTTPYSSDIRICFLFYKNKWRMLEWKNYIKLNPLCINCTVSEVIQTVRQQHMGEHLDCIMTGLQHIAF